MSKKFIYLLLAVSLGLNAGVIGMTLLHRPAPTMQGPPGGPGAPGGPRGPGGPGAGGALRDVDPERVADQHLRAMSEHLGLDSGQQEAVRVSLVRFLPELASYEAEADEANRRLAEAFGAPDFDPEGFQQLVTKVAVARSRVDSVAAVLLTANAEVLTAEQRRRFAEVAPTMNTKPQRPRPEAGPPPREHR